MSTCSDYFDDCTKADCRKAKTSQKCEQTCGLCAETPAAQPADGAAECSTASKKVCQGKADLRAGVRLRGCKWMKQADADGRKATKKCVSLAAVCSGKKNKRSCTKVKPKKSCAWKGTKKQGSCALK